MPDNLLNKEVIQLGNIMYQKVATRGGTIVLKSIDLPDMPSSYADGSILVSGTGGYALETPASLGMMNVVEVSTATTASVQTYYVCNNVSVVPITLPATAPMGSMIGILGKGAGGWTCTAATGDYIHHGSFVSLAGGAVRSTYYKDTMLLLCITTNSDWAIIWTNGNIEVEVA